jgi:hypothetical protein
MKMKPFTRGSGPGSDTGDIEYYFNNRYQVAIRKAEDHNGVPLKVLSIRRQDRKAIMDWRDLQWIKNELLGPEEEAIQIFPAESRLLDTSNQYWLWSYPGQYCGLGFSGGRAVTEKLSVTMSGHGTSQQRPFAEHVRPPDLEEQEKRYADLLSSSDRVSVHRLMTDVLTDVINGKGQHEPD